MLKKNRSMQLMAPVESLTGKFALQRETCANRSSVRAGLKLSFKYFGARVTTGYYPHLGGTLSKTSFYLRKYGRYNLFGQNERQNMTVFGNSGKQANIDLKNITAVQTIKTKFMAQTPVYGVEPRSYSMRGWVVAVYYEFYKNREGQGAIDWATAPAE